jgi:hypothetical protein
LGIWQYRRVLYLNDTHELDFEVGYGRKNTRNELEAEPDDLIVYMTSQKIHSYLIKQKNQRETMAHLKLTLNSRRKYKVSWNINGQTSNSSTYITEKKVSLRFIAVWKT